MSPWTLGNEMYMDSFQGEDMGMRLLKREKWSCLGRLSGFGCWYVNHDSRCPHELLLQGRPANGGTNSLHGNLQPSLLVWNER